MLLTARFTLPSPRASRFRFSPGFSHTHTPARTCPLYCIARHSRTRTPSSFSLGSLRGTVLACTGPHCCTHTSCCHTARFTRTLHGGSWLRTHTHARGSRPSWLVARSCTLPPRLAPAFHTSHWMRLSAWTVFYTTRLPAFCGSAVPFTLVAAAHGSFFNNRTVCGLYRVSGQCVFFRWFTPRLFTGCGLSVTLRCVCGSIAFSWFTQHRITPVYHHAYALDSRTRGSGLRTYLFPVYVHARGFVRHSLHGSLTPLRFTLHRTSGSYAPHLVYLHWLPTRFTGSSPV